MILRNSTEDFINSTGCNVTLGTEIETREYDAEGALKFTVAVVMVYGVAVMGVFAVSYVSRRKPQNYDVDKQARSYVKNMDNVRRKLERNHRLNSINVLLKNIHGENNFPKSKEKFIEQGVLSLAAFPVMVASGRGESSKANNSENANDKSKLLTPQSPNSDYFSRETLTVLSEENENETDDDVFMNDEEKRKFKCDMYVPVS